MKFIAVPALVVAFASVGLGQSCKSELNYCGDELKARSES